MTSSHSTLFEAMIHEDDDVKRAELRRRYVAALRSGDDVVPREFRARYQHAHGTRWGTKKWAVRVLPAEGHGEREWTTSPQRWRWQAQQHANALKACGARRAEVVRL